MNVERPSPRIFFTNVLVDMSVNLNISGKYVFNPKKGTSSDVVSLINLWCVLLQPVRHLIMCIIIILAIYFADFLAAKAHI